jgi:hypothetical protein
MKMLAKAKESVVYVRDLQKVRLLFGFILYVYGYELMIDSSGRRLEWDQKPVSTRDQDMWRVQDGLLNMVCNYVS